MVLKPKNLDNYPAALEPISELRCDPASRMLCIEIQCKFAAPKPVCNDADHRCLPGRPRPGDMWQWHAKAMVEPMAGRCRWWWRPVPLTRSESKSKCESERSVVIHELIRWQMRIENWPNANATLSNVPVRAQAGDFFLAEMQVGGLVHC